MFAGIASLILLVVGMVAMGALVVQHFSSPAKTTQVAPQIEEPIIHVSTPAERAMEGLKRTPVKPQKKTKKRRQKSNNKKKTPPKERTTQPEVKENLSPLPKEVIPINNQSFAIRFMLPRLEGKIRCGDGQTVEFVGGITMKFTSQQACIIETLNGARGGVAVSEKRTFTCAAGEGSVQCQ